MTADRVEHTNSDGEQVSIVRDGNAFHIELYLPGSDGGEPEFTGIDIERHALRRLIRHALTMLEAMPES